MTKATSIDRLRDILKALRTPETGCPWDLKQNFKSIAAYTIEEAYESSRLLSVMIWMI